MIFKKSAGLRIVSRAVLAASVCSAAIMAVQPATAAADVRAAPVSELVEEVSIPYTQFTLDNGLRVIVHEDHKAPIVAVSVWYDVGSANEPEGKTGFAHLFEHIMFNGSENAPDDYFVYTKRLGATDLNGTTWLDRTNYFQTVPKAGLDGALFLESDRMGHLLGGVTQEKLDNQIGVVSNEKRQGDSQPYGLVEYRQIEMLYPSDHPYGHSTIGSLEDLERASLDDVKSWFTGHYGPNNAVLVLAGDITAEEARARVERWFGDIPRGPSVKQMDVPVPTLDAPVKEIMHDKVPATRIYKTWTIPGLGDPDLVAIDAGASVLGGLASSRLDNALVRGEQTAVRVSANVMPFVHASIFEMQADVKPGVDPEAVSQRMDELLKEIIEKGVTKDELSRVATSTVASRIRGLEQVGGFGGKATALAEGELYLDDPSHYKKELEALAELTPADISAAMKEWLTRPVAEIWVEPGEREAYEEVGADASGGVRSGVTSRPAHYFAPGDAAQGIGAPQMAVDRSQFPEIGEINSLEYPDVETATLTNGVPVYFARRDAVPTVAVDVVFDIGSAADPKDRLGLHGMMVEMLTEGTETLGSIEFAEARERLGAVVGASGGVDDTTVSLRAVTPNLASSLDLLADVVRRPAFDADELERVRQQQLTRIASEASSPIQIGLRNLPPLIYGKAHPYGAPLTGTGEASVVAELTRDEIAAFHRRWMRPEMASIFVVGDTTLDAIKPLLDERFGKWPSNRMALPQKNFDVAIPDQTGRIIVIDQPNSPQSLILAGEVLDKKGVDDLFALNVANDILGGEFTARINSDLRETKGWSYGAYTILQRPVGPVPMLVYAPVQTNQTGPSIAALIDQLEAFIGDNGVTAAELERVVNGNVRELPGSFEQSTDVLGQMKADKKFGRPFDYAVTAPQRYEALTTASLDSAMRDALNPEGFTWLVIGDTDRIREQIDALGMPVTYMKDEEASAEDAAAEAEDAAMAAQEAAQEAAEASAKAVAPAN